MKKKITIIISHLNCNRELGECLKSISLKHFSDQLKILIQDGNSTEPVKPIIETYKSTLDIRLNIEGDTGIFDAWNKALLAVDTEYVCFLGSDDRLTDQWENLLRVALRGGANFITGRGLMRKKDRYLQIGAKSNKAMWPIKMNIVHSSSIFKTEYINRSTFSQENQVAEDYIHLLANKKHIKYEFVDQVVVVMDGYGNSQRRGATGDAEILQFLKQNAKLRYLLFALKLKMKRALR